jgi:2-C-methyl-D-erythritol 4-phosphate cytidylyltransferase
MSGAWAIIAAAGEGSRFGGPKAFAAVGRIPLVAHSLMAVAGVKEINSALLVLPEAELASAKELLSTTSPTIPIETVPGGSSRQASVRAGLERVPAEVERIVVHDAARPLATPAIFEAVLAALDDAAGAIAAVPATDTMKESSDGRVVRTIARDGLWRAQTPQAFRASVLREAHERAAADGFEATDDAVLLERIGEAVALVQGDERNIKITTAEDLAVVEALLAARGAGT